MDNLYILLGWIAGIVLIIAFGKALRVPVRIALKLLVNGLIGGIIIVIINFLGHYINFNIPLNIFSALIAGTLGLPGFILLIILRHLL